MHRLDLEKKGTRESRAVPAPDANAELAISMQVMAFIVLFMRNCHFFF